MSVHNPISVLSEAQCWEQLQAQEFGRLAFTLVGEVQILPINYALDGTHRLLFRTAEGSKLLGLTMSESVAFEIDSYDDHEAVSVVVKGRAYALEGHDADGVDQLRLRPWVDTVKYHVIAIDAEEVTGRRFELTKPWTHLTPHADGS